MSADKYLSIDEILAAEDVEFTEAEAWGGKVRFGTLSAGALMDFASKNEGPGKRTAGIRLIVDSLVDADGKRIGKPSHIEAFKTKNGAVLNRLCDVIMELNGMADKALNFSTRFTKAGTNREELTKVLRDMQRAVAGLEEALNDEVIDDRKLLAISDKNRRATEAEAKNGSSETI